MFALFSEYVTSIFFPFILGGAIAFVLNVPMNFVERHLFPQERMEKKPVLQKLAIPNLWLLPHLQHF